MPAPPPTLQESPATISTTQPGPLPSKSDAMALEDSSGRFSSPDNVQLSDRANAVQAAKDLSATGSSSPMKDGSPSDSDGDGNNERPVREKLKKANLGTLRQVAGESVDPDEDAVMGSQTTPPGTENALTADERVLSDSEERHIGPMHRGRPARKRSFDDVDVDDADEDMKHGDANGNKTSQDCEPGTHARKRSRDASTGSESKKHGDEQKVQPRGAYMDEGSEERSDVLPPTGFPKGKPVSNTGVRTPTEVMDEDKEAEPLLSPRRLERKRSRDQFDKDLEKEELEQARSGEIDERNSGGEAEPDVTARSASRLSRDEPEKKRHRDTSQEANSKEENSEIKIPPTSGFAYTSAMSPFGTLANKSPPVFGSSVATSTHATPTFASSGFGALSGSSTSPFGTLGTSPPASSPFASLAAGKGTGISGFGALLSAGKPGPLPNSNFGATQFGMATSSGFGALGGGFGSSTGAGLRDFSSNGSSAILGSKEKSPRPFGAPEDESEEDEDESTDGEVDGEDRKGRKDEKKTDVEPEKRFYPQEMETGEERETTIFSCRAKLFSFDKGEKAWKERGVGIFKLNATVNETDNEYDQWSRSSGGSEGEETDIPATEKKTEDTTDSRAPQVAPTTERRRARLLMRADGVLRVVLNVPVFKGMKVGDEKGNPPTGRVVNLIVVEGDNAVPLLVKTSSPANAKELCKSIYEIQEEM